MQGKERALEEKDRQKEILAKERELMLLKKSRAELLLQDKERSGYRKYLPYIVVFLGISAISFLRHWMGYNYFEELPRYDVFILLFIFFLLLDFIRGRRRKRIHKMSKVYTEQIQRLQEEILQMKQMNT